MIPRQRKTKSGKPPWTGSNSFQSLTLCSQATSSNKHFCNGLIASLRTLQSWTPRPQRTSATCVHTSAKSWRLAGSTRLTGGNSMTSSTDNKQLQQTTGIGQLWTRPYSATILLAMLKECQAALTVAHWNMTHKTARANVQQNEDGNPQLEKGQKQISATTTSCSIHICAAFIISVMVVQRCLNPPCE